MSASGCVSAAKPGHQPGKARASSGSDVLAGAEVRKGIEPHRRGAACIRSRVSSGSRRTSSSRLAGAETAAEASTEVEGRRRRVRCGGLRGDHGTRTREPRCSRSSVARGRRQRRDAPRAPLRRVDPVPNAGVGNALIGAKLERGTLGGGNTGKLRLRVRVRLRGHPTRCATASPTRCSTPSGRGSGGARWLARPSRPPTGVVVGGEVRGLRASWAASTASCATACATSATRRRASTGRP
jgi:hypothetical protein